MLSIKSLTVPTVVCLLGLVSAAQDRSRSTYLISGSVALEDGRPVTEPVEIFLICSGSVLQRVHSQVTGQFSFTLADNKSPLSGFDETAGSPIGGGFSTFNQVGRGFGDTGKYGTGRSTWSGRLYLGDCEIVASLPGFTSSVIYPGNRDVMEKPDVGTLKLRRREYVHGTTISLNGLQAPENARRSYESAMTELNKQKKNYSKAIRELKKAVKIYPSFAAAWRYLGDCYLTEKQTSRARDAYEKSVAADPEYLIPYVKIAELDLQEQRHEAAALWSARVLARNPEVIRASYVNAYANFSLEKFDQAETSIRRVQASREARIYPGSHYLLGSLLARKREFPSAAAEYRRFLEVNPSYAGAAELRKHLALWEEQGLIPR